MIYLVIQISVVQRISFHSQNTLFVLDLPTKFTLPFKIEPSLPTIESNNQTINMNGFDAEEVKQLPATVVTKGKMSIHQLMKDQEKLKKMKRNYVHSFSCEICDKSFSKTRDLKFMLMLFISSYVLFSVINVTKVSH